MRSKSIVLTIIGLVLLASCMPAASITDTSLAPPTTGKTPTHNSIPTPTPSPTPLSPTVTPSPIVTDTPTLTPTLDPGAHLRKYEGDCAFCFVDGSEPDMPILDGEGPGYKPQPDDPREQIVIDETFSVPAGKEVLIEDKIVWVRSDQPEAAIEVYGTLIIKNSLLLWDQTVHNQITLYVKRGGILSITSSYAFPTNQYWVEWDYEDGSTVLFDNFVGKPNTALFGSVDYTAVNFSTVYLILFYNIYDSNVIVSDAHSLYFEIHPSSGKYDITLPATREWVNWNLSDLWPDTTIEITHSYLFEQYLTLSADNHITVRDSPNIYLGWNIRKDSEGVVECELRDMGDPSKGGGVFYENQTWDLPCINASLTLINSHLLRAYPQITGNIHLRVYDSNLIDPRARGNSAILEIYNSNLENVAAYEGAKVYLENVRIMHDLESSGADTVIYVYGVMPWESGWKFEIIEVGGGRYIELDKPGLP